MTSQLFALTSLSPAEHAVDAQQRAVGSWHEAGLQVRSFSHPSEIATLASRYAVEFVPVTETVTLNRMIKWAAEREATVMIVASETELRLEPWEVRRARWLADGGLCYFIPHNHDGDLSHATPEPFGMDAFLFSARDAGPLEESPLSIGQAFCDYWLPYLFATNGRPLVRVESPAAFHRRQSRSWSWEEWYRCGVELARVTRRPVPDSMESCFVMEAEIRDEISRRTTILTPRPFAIRDWVEQRFCDDARAKTFLELGAHRGTDTFWLSQFPGVTLHAFEPDPRNEQPPRPNVTVHRAAVAGVDGIADFVLSEAGWGQEWTQSSSLRRPKNHLTRYPVTFGKSVSVQTISLDSFAARQGISTVDFIWADIQGAEGEMVRGGLELLRRTRYLYTEYSDDEMYEGQATLGDLLTMLPDYRVVELWSDDVLLENRAFETEAAP